MLIIITRGYNSKGFFVEAIYKDADGHPMAARVAGLSSQWTDEEFISWLLWKREQVAKREAGERAP